MYPHLQYSSPIINQGCACKTLLAPFQVIQNKILKCISCTKSKLFISPKCKQMKIQSYMIPVHKIELGKFKFNLRILKNQLLPKNFNSSFESVSDVHKYNNRINQNSNKSLLRERTTVYL